MTTRTIPTDTAKVADTTISDQEWAQAENAHERFKALLETKDFTAGTTKPYGCDANQDLSHSMVIVQIVDGSHKVIDVVEFK